MTKTPATRLISPEMRILVLLALTTLILASAPYWAGRSNIRLFGEFYSFLALAVLWNLLAGYAGLISVGQQAFVGLGGYTLFVVSAGLGLSPILELVIVSLTRRSTSAGLMLKGVRPVGNNGTWQLPHNAVVVTRLLRIRPTADPWTIRTSCRSGGEDAGR